MRKFLSKTMLLAALTALFLAATAAAASIGTGVVDADTLRVRTEPSTDASTITYLSDGTQVQVLEDLGDWYQISWNGYTGYVSAEFLLYTPAGTVTSNAPAVRDVTGRIGVLDSEGVYFRAGPSVADEVYDVMADGDEVVILTLADGWCQVTLTKGCPARGLPAWMVFAASSLPVPLSPSSSTVVSDSAIFLALRSAS